MSLVSEALKKAEREAAVRQARADGVPEPPPLQPFRTRPRRRSTLPWGIALVVLAALAGAGSLLLRTSRGGEAPPSAGRSHATEEIRPERAATSPHEPSDGLAAAPAAPPALSPPPPQVRDSRPEPRAVPSERRPPAAEPGSSALRSSPPAPVPPSAAASDSAVTKTGAELAGAPPHEPTDFLRRAELANGTVLELGGIAYSESAPLAYVNGKLLAVGESISGFRVERILRDRVELAAPGRRITLRLKSP